jgi:hypothetical protein
MKTCFANALKPLLFLSLALLAGCASKPVAPSPVAPSSDSIWQVWDGKNYVKVTNLVVLGTTNSAVILPSWLSAHLNPTWWYVPSIIGWLALFAFCFYWIKRALSERITTVPETPVATPESLKTIEKAKDYFATEPPLKTEAQVIRRQILTKLSKKVSKRKKK